MSYLVQRFWKQSEPENATSNILVLDCPGVINSSYGNVILHLAHKRKKISVVQLITNYLNARDVTIFASTIYDLPLHNKIFYVR